MCIVLKPLSEKVRGTISMALLMLSNGITGQQNLKFLLLLTVTLSHFSSHRSQPTCQHSLVLLVWQTLFSPSAIKLNVFICIFLHFTMYKFSYKQVKYTIHI